ncbi:MAG TPA: DUF362 domain-containing protein [Polyangia bacterium]|jgi:uncharacterized protein (DUF362 family)
MDRRRFLRHLGAAGAVAASGAFVPLLGCGKGAGKPGGGSAAAPGAAPASRQARALAADLVVCEGNDPYLQTVKAIEAIGGIDLFVKPGDRVVLSPNLAFARTPEQGANTHPRVLRAVLDQCVKAGATKITVLDYVLDAKEVAFKMNGAEEAVAGTIARLISPEDERQYQKLDVSKLKTHAAHNLEQMVATEITKANVYIAIPVFKDHEAGVLSGALKKVMGVIWDRKGYHRADLHACIAEINTLIKPSLIIGDATRVMQTRGPKGPGEMAKPRKVLAAVDPVAADAYAVRWLRKDGTLKPSDVAHLVQAAALGRGRLDLAQAKILEVTA